MVANQVMIETARSYHEQCFICGSRCSRANKLYQVEPESVSYAYSKFKIMIKFHARCCGRHLDENHLIKEQDFNGMPTSNWIK